MEDSMFSNYGFAIVDLSKNNPFPSPIEFLKAVQHATGLDPSRVRIVARNNQRAELQPTVTGIAQVKWLDDISLFQLELAAHVVKQELLAILQTAPRDLILVTSYNGAVLGEVQRLALPNVELQSLSKFRPAFGHAVARAMPMSQFVVDATAFTQIPPPAAKPIWRFDGFCSEDEGRMLLIRALHQRGAVDRRHTISMPNVKPTMARVDTRFVGSGQSNGTGGMVGALVVGAHFAGMIEVAVSYNGTHYIWLTPTALQMLTASMPPAIAPTEIVVASAEVVAERSVALNNTAPVSSDAQSKPVVEPVAPTAPRRARERSPHKSQRMQDALIESGYGPRTKQRLSMLDRVGSILEKRDKNSLTQILDSARDALIQEVPEGPGRQADVAASNAVRRMLREFLPDSDALKDEHGKPIPKGFRAGPTTISDFESDWRSCFSS
jgi:hypothetical protein